MLLFVAPPLQTLAAYLQKVCVVWVSGGHAAVHLALDLSLAFVIVRGVPLGQAGLALPVLQQHELDRLFVSGGWDRDNTEGGEGGNRKGSGAEPRP